MAGTHIEITPLSDYNYAQSVLLAWLKWRFGGSTENSLVDVKVCPGWHTTLTELKLENHAVENWLRTFS